MLSAAVSQEDRKMWKISKNLEYNRSKMIGVADESGAITFEGRMNGDIPVAVKRIQLVDIQTRNLPKVNDYIERILHPNLILYFQCNADEDFLYIAMELGTGTLEDLIKRKCKEYTIGGEQDILLQATEGLHYLHENGIAHGNIKPTNILFISNNNKPTIKLSDFCLRRTLMIEKEQKDTFVPLDTGKVVSKKKTSSSSIRFDEQSMNKGCWIPPESYQPGDDENNFKMDIFSLGLVFFYTITVEGKHPFGETPLEQLIRIQKRDPNICLKSDDFMRPYGDVGNRLVNFIYTMCKMDPGERPSVKTVLSVLKADVEASAQKFTDDVNAKRKKGTYQINIASQQGDNYASSSHSKRVFRDTPVISKGFDKSTKSVVGRSRIAYHQIEISALGTSFSPRKSPRHIKAMKL